MTPTRGTIVLSGQEISVKISLKEGLFLGVLFSFFFFFFFFAVEERTKWRL